MIGWILRHPRLLLALNLAVTVFFALQLPKAVLDNDVANFIPLENPARQDYSEVENIFGGQMFMLAAVYKPEGTLLDAESLRVLDALTTDLENLPFVDDVTSLTNTDYITSVGDSIVVTQLVPEAFSGSPDEVETLKQRLGSWELYHNTVLNAEGNAVQIIVRIGVAIGAPEGTDPKIVVYEGVKAALKKHLPESMNAFVSGTPAFSALMSSSMRQDLQLLIPLVVLILVGTLLLSFRKASGIILPLLSVVVAAVWSLGLMALLGVKLTMIATVIPVIMVAVGSAYGIHIITHYYEEKIVLGNMDHQTHVGLIAEVLKKIGLPVFLAALTTIAGFASLSFTEILPVRDFGIYSSFGVLAALLASLTIIPSFLVLAGPGKNATAAHPEAAHHDRFSSALSKVLGGFNRRPGLTLGLSAVLLLLSVYGASRLIVDNALVEYFPKDSEIVQSDIFLRERFAGTKTFSLVFSGPEPGSLTDPRVLSVMNDTARFIEGEFDSVGKVMGYHQLIERINQVFNADVAGNTAPVPATISQDQEEPTFGFDEEPAFGFSEEPAFGFDSTPAAEPTPAASTIGTPVKTFTEEEIAHAVYEGLAQGGTDADAVLRSLLAELDIDGSSWYEIPADPARYGQNDIEGLKGVISNYLLLISSGTEEWANDPLEPSQARLNIQLRSSGNNETALVSEAALAFARERLPEGFTVKAAGTALIEKAITDLIVTTQVWNILQSLGAVFLILAITNKSLVAGILGIIPLGLALALNFGFMGLFGIKLNIGTAMVASIAIGVGIDYTIHFLESLKWEAARNGDWDHVIRRSLMTSGKAIIFNAASVGLGFLVLVFSRFQPLIYLGGLITITMATTSLASMTLLPVLMKTFRPKFLFPKSAIVMNQGGQP